MRMMNKLIAFTLTELLLAIAIVGVIAALVLPASVSKFNDKLIDNAHDRNLQSITTAIQNLAVTENKSSFNSTMMYVNASEDIVEGDYANTSGKFLKKYLRVSKYCGNSNGDCFAKKYYEYPEGSHVKREYTPTYKGGCAILKSGASLCLEPQVGSANIKGLIDINGPKGPNVWERDLRVIDIPAINALSRNNATETVVTTAGETFELEETNVCDTNPDSLACCLSLDSSTITAGHRCCSYPDIKSAIPACETSSPETSSVHITLDCRTEQEGDTCVPTSGEPYHCPHNRYTCKLVDLSTDPTGDTYRLDIRYRAYHYNTNAYPAHQPGGHCAESFTVTSSGYPTTYTEGCRNVYGFSHLNFKLTNKTTNEVLEDKTYSTEPPSVVGLPGPALMTGGNTPTNYTYHSTEIIINGGGTLSKEDLTLQ